MKNKFIKIGVSIVAVVIIILVYLHINAPPPITSGVIGIVVVDQEGQTIIDDEWEFSSSENNKITLRLILEEHYEIVVEKKMLMGINGIIADNTNYFWKIWINCQMATKGIDALYFKDGDVIKLVYTAVGDYNNNAC